MLSQDEDGSTKLHLAAYFREHASILHRLGDNRQLLDSMKELGVLSEVVDKADNKGRTPLGLATSIGHYTIVELLLHYGANVDKADNDGSTPLMKAASDGRLDIVDLLIENGADVLLKNKNGKTALGSLQYYRSIGLTMEKDHNKIIENLKKAKKAKKSGCCIQ